MDPVGQLRTHQFPVMHCPSARTHYHKVVMWTSVAARACFLFVSMSVITLFGELKQGVCGSLSLRQRSHKYINTKIERSNFLLGVCVFSHFPTRTVISCARVHGWHFILPIQISHGSVAPVMWFIFFIPWCSCICRVQSLRTVTDPGSKTLPSVRKQNLCPQGLCETPCWSVIWWSLEQGIGLSSPHSFTWRGMNCRYQVKLPNITFIACVLAEDKTLINECLSQQESWDDNTQKEAILCTVHTMAGTEDAVAELVARKVISHLYCISYYSRTC